MGPLKPHISVAIRGNFLKGPSRDLIITFLVMYINIGSEGAKRMKPGSFQWHPVAGKEAMSTK